MNSAVRSLGDVVAALRDEGLVDVAEIDVEAAIGRMAGIQPWYVRTMVGFGAWLASLLLIGFVGSIGFTFEWGFAFFGLGFMAGAVLLRRQASGDFPVQAALAASLAGQALFVFGVMQASEWDKPEFAFGMIIAINAVLFVIFPDRIHRVLSALLASGSLTVLFYLWELNALVPLLGPLVALALVLVMQNRARLVGAGAGSFVRPLQSGFMLSAFGCLMLSTVYVLPELGGSYEYYPHPWVSTMLLGALLLYVGRTSWADWLEGAPLQTQATLFGLLVVVIGCAWLAPGLLLALIVILLGASSGQRSVIGAGLGFLVIFLAAYFYGIQITMLQKSATLVATGIVILSARWIILRILPEASADE